MTESNDHLPTDKENEKTIKFLQYEIADPQIRAKEKGRSDRHSQCCISTEFKRFILGFFGL